jgi:hypothetical protein
MFTIENMGLKHLRDGVSDVLQYCNEQVYGQ